MKQKIYIAALLAGLLALAGCGGGSSAVPVLNDPPLSQADCGAGDTFRGGECLDPAQLAAAEAKEVVDTATQKIKDATTAKEVDDVISALDKSEISTQNFETLEGLAEDQKDDISHIAVRGVIAAIDGADDEKDVNDLLNEAGENPDIRQAAKDATGDGSFRKAGSDKIDDLTAMATKKGQEDALEAAKIDVAALDVSDADAIAKAKQDIEALTNAINRAGEGVDTDSYVTQRDNAQEKVATQERKNGQMSDLESALADLNIARSAAAFHSSSASAAAIAAAIEKVLEEHEDLQDAINDAEDLDNDEKAKYRSAYNQATSEVAGAQGRLTEVRDAENEQQQKDDNAARVMAKKLFDGLAYNVTDADNARKTPAQDAQSALAESGANFTSLADDSVTVTDGATPVSPKKSSTSVADLAGWKGADYRNTASGTTDHVVLYHNRGTDSEPFNKKHAAFLARVLQNGVPVFLIEQDTFDTPANEAYVKGGQFATAGTKPHTEDAGDQASISGTFDGVSGTYSCTQSDTTTCNSVVSSNGIDLTGGWTFIPSSLTAPTQTMDPNYLVFGWWSRETAAGVDVIALTAADVDGSGAGVAAIVSGNDAAAAISGTATYTGGAAGKYAIYNPFGTNSSAGAFTADAKLTADFTDKKISGDLINFKSGGESMDWKVSLNVGTAVNITASGIDGTVAGTDTTWSMGDDDSNATKAGDWSGDFYKANTNPAANTAAPVAVLGEFDSEYTVGGLKIGEMVGAFGAELQSNP